MQGRIWSMQSGTDVETQSQDIDPGVIFVPFDVCGFRLGYRFFFLWLQCLCLMTTRSFATNCQRVLDHRQATAHHTVWGESKSLRARAVYGYPVPKVCCIIPPPPLRQHVFRIGTRRMQSCVYMSQRLKSGVRSSPCIHQAGVGGVITGWDQGCLGMKLGEARELLIPAAEGYGSGGFPAWGIPPGMS